MNPVHHQSVPTAPPKRPVCLRLQCKTHQPPSTGKELPCPPRERHEPTAARHQVRAARTSGALLSNASRKWQQGSAAAILLAAPPLPCWSPPWVMVRSPFLTQSVTVRRSRRSLLRVMITSPTLA